MMLWIELNFAIEASQILGLTFTSPQGEVDWRTEDYRMKVSDLTKYRQEWLQIN